jgi:C-terminal processing protease CtpA/Prc
MNYSTASSGETVLVSFIGETNTKTIGQPSRGSTTCNELFPLSDGAQLLLTVSVYADRNKKPYYGRIEPDISVDRGKELESALNWIYRIKE